jgi:hypothetical protein
VTHAALTRTKELPIPTAKAASVTTAQRGRDAPRVRSGDDVARLHRAPRLLQKGLWRLAGDWAFPTGWKPGAPEVLQ